MKIELVVCQNTNDAKIYQYGQSNSKLEATLKGVSIFISCRPPRITNSFFSSSTIKLLLALILPPILTVLLPVLKTEMPMFGLMKVVFGNLDLSCYVSIVLLPLFVGLPTKKNLQLLVVLVVSLFVTLKRIMIGGQVSILRSLFVVLFCPLIGIPTMFCWLLVLPI